MTVTEALGREWDEFMVARNQQGKRTVAENWRNQNPGEWQKLQAYREGGTRPSLATSLGKQMVEHVAAWRLAATPMPPVVVFPSVSRYPSEVI